MDGLEGRPWLSTSRSLSRPLRPSVSLCAPRNGKHTWNSEQTSTAPHAARAARGHLMRGKGEGRPTVAERVTRLIAHVAVTRQK